MAGSMYAALEAFMRFDITYRKIQTSPTGGGGDELTQPSESLSLIIDQTDENNISKNNGQAQNKQAYNEKNCYTIFIDCVLFIYTH